MVMLILTWTGVVVGLGLLLLMALGPLIVEVDSRLYARRRRVPPRENPVPVAESPVPVAENPVRVAEMRVRVGGVGG